MAKKKKKFLEIPESELKYIQDLVEEYKNYFSQLVLNIFKGVSENIGISNPDKLASKSPYELRKGFLSGMKQIGNKIKGYIGRKLKKSPYDPFKVKGMKLYKKGKPLTNQQWKNFERQVEDYLVPYIDALGEEMSVKGLLLAMASNEAEGQGHLKRNYGKKSYSQIESEYFGGVVPDNMLSAEERYTLDRDYKNGMNLAFVRAAEFMTNTSDTVRKSVKEQVASAYRTDKTAEELASDLFWMHEDKPELKDYTAEIVMRDWGRVAHTELHYIHEAGKQAQYETQAKKSIDNPEKAVYFIFLGRGGCDWCAAHQGTIVRQIPMKLVGNERDDSLKSRGIDDPHTDIAVWQTKSNIGYKKSEWRVCGTIHPWCGDGLTRINPAIQEYDKEVGRIKYKGDKRLEKYIPGDFLDEIESEKQKYRERQDLIAKRNHEGMIRREKK